MPLPLTPLPFAFAILAARSNALLFVRGAIEGGACTTLGRGLGLMVAGVAVSLAVVPFVVVPLTRLSASALLDRATRVGAVRVVDAREAPGRPTDAAEAGRAEVGGLVELRDEEREYEPGLLTINRSKRYT